MQIDGILCFTLSLSARLPSKVLFEQGPDYDHQTRHLCWPDRLCHLILIKGANGNLLEGVILGVFALLGTVIYARTVGRGLD
ncbi:MAG: hypothetical protein JWQ22_532 [Devosia sp.]|nr:hypothetical protein [Devosia sp.]